MTKSLSSADIELSKGAQPAKGPRVMISPINGQPIGVWNGYVDLCLTQSTGSRITKS